MTEPGPVKPSITPLGFIGEARKLKREQLAPGQLEPALAMLRRWQSRRLARTYADLLATARYGPAFQFFLDEIYAPKDFSQRDHDLLQMYGLVKRLVPEPLLKPVTVTVRLHELTQRLDDWLLDALINKLGVSERFTIAQYAAAYRLCDNYAERMQQIDWIVEVATNLDGVASQRLTGTTLALARAPAGKAGWGELATFLEQGYKAFKPMRGAEEFVATIRSRETAALDRMIAADPDPFGFGAGVAEP